MDETVISCNSFCLWFAEDDLIRLAGDNPYFWAPQSDADADQTDPHTRTERKEYIQQCT